MKILVILFLAYVLFVHNLGIISLWDPDEPRQAIMAREMVERSDYIHPYLNGSPYTEKPPLFSWLVVLASKVGGGLNEFTARIPSALCATGLLLMVFVMGRRFVDEDGGLLSALVLATNYQFLGNSREAVMDMTFAFFIGASIFLAWFSVERRSRALLVLAFLPAALAILTKGPAGLVIPAAVILLYLFTTKRAKAFILPLAGGCVICLAVASLWFVLAGEAYAREFLLRQNLVRYTQGFDHVETALYYLHKVFFNFLPWSILLPFSLIHAWKRKLWLPLIWFLFTFFFFEFSRSKRAIYLLPCYPACALLVGIYVKDKWQSLVEGPWTKWLTRLFGLLLILLPIAALVIVPPLKVYRTLFPTGGSLLAIPMILLAVVGSLFFYYLMRFLPQRSLRPLFTYLVVCGVLYHSFYMPALNTHVKSPRLITSQIQQDGSDIYLYRTNSPALIYYLGKPVKVIMEPQEIPQGVPKMTVIAEKRPDSMRRLAPLFGTIKEVRYEKDTYIICERHDGK